MSYALAKRSGCDCCHKKQVLDAILLGMFNVRNCTLSLAFVLALVIPARVSESRPHETISPFTEQIVDRMMEHNEQQNRVLIGFRTQRTFFAANTRFKMDSTLIVETVFRQPDFMESSVISKEGSDFIRQRVFDEILKAENETHKKADKQQVDITPQNYDFTFIGEEVCQDRPCYRVGISPKRKDKYSLNGDIWIDTSDFAIVRVHGSPAKKPSFWTLKTEIDKRYRKLDGVWLTDRLESSSDILIAGHSTLSIQYEYTTVETEHQ